MDKVEQAAEKGGPWLTVEEALQVTGGLPFTQEDRGRATQWLEGNYHLVRHWTLPKILAAYAAHVTAEKDAEIERLRRLDAEYGRLESAIIMADPDFDGDSDHPDCISRLMDSVRRIQGRLAKLEAVAKAARLLVNAHEHQAATDKRGVLTFVPQALDKTRHALAALEGEKADG